MQLDVLVGNAYGGSVAGTVTINGKQADSRGLRNLSCYVMQNPMLLSSATVTKHVDDMRRTKKILNMLMESKMWLLKMVM